MPTREDAKAAATAKPEAVVEAPESDAKPTTPKAEKPKKEPKAKAEPKDCSCKVPNHDKTGQPASGSDVKFAGCNGGKSTRKFAPGHDAKLVGWNTRRYASGQVTAEQAVEDVRTKSDGSALLLGKIKSAVKREDDAKAAAARREQAAKDEAAAKAATPEAEVDKVAAEATA